MDFIEVKPVGQNGERYIYTVIDVASRYPFLRASPTRDSVELACVLLDVFLDMGVVRAIVQSDNEFCNAAFEELCQSFGCSQIFSAALHPQSQGIVERSHRELRSTLAKLVEAYARANPRQWPKYIRWLEYKLRHKPLAAGVTPYRVAHGYFGSSELSTALGAMQEIPLQILTQDWLRGIVSETRELEATLAEHWSSRAEEQMRRHEERTEQP